jgi:hypothetical protein
MSAATYERSHLYIGGDWHRSSDPAMTEIVNPATEKICGAGPAAPSEPAGCVRWQRSSPSAATTQRTW